NLISHGDQTACFCVCVCVCVCVCMCACVCVSALKVELTILFLCGGVCSVACGGAPYDLTRTEALWGVVMEGWSEGHTQKQKVHPARTCWHHAAPVLPPAAGVRGP